MQNNLKDFAETVESTGTKQHIAKTITKEPFPSAMNRDMKFFIVISSYKSRKCSMATKIQKQRRQRQSKAKTKMIQVMKVTLNWDIK